MDTVFCGSHVIHYGINELGLIAQRAADDVGFLGYGEGIHAPARCLHDGGHTCVWFAAITLWNHFPTIGHNTRDVLHMVKEMAGENSPLQPTGQKWANAGCVSVPSRTVTWRVLDSKFFGVAQQRRRVWVIAGARSDFDPGAVLFESDHVSPRIQNYYGKKKKSESLSAPGIDGEFRRYSLNFSTNYTGTLTASYSGSSDQDIVMPGGLIIENFLRRVRRLTPEEFEKIQGFPVGYTDLGQTSPGHRYKALGNSMTVPVIKWIGERIAAEIALNSRSTK